MFSFFILSALFFSATLACNGVCVTLEACNKFKYTERVSGRCKSSQVCCALRSDKKRQLGLIGGLLGGGGGGGSDFGSLISGAQKLANIADKFGVDVPPELQGALQAAMVANNLVNNGLPDDLSGAIDVGKMLADAAGKLTGGTGSDDLVNKLAGSLVGALDPASVFNGIDPSALFPNGLPNGIDPSALLPAGGIPDPNLPDTGMLLAQAQAQADMILAQARAQADELQRQADLLQAQAKAFAENPNNYAKNAAGEFVNQEGEPVNKFGQLLYPPQQPPTPSPTPVPDAGKVFLPQNTDGNGGFNKFNPNENNPDNLQTGAGATTAGEGGLEGSAIIAIAVVGALFCCLVLILGYCLVSKDSPREEYGFNVNNQMYDPSSRMMSARQWPTQQPIGPDTQMINAQPSYSPQERAFAGTVSGGAAQLQLPYGNNNNGGGRDRFTTAFELPNAPNYGGSVQSQWGEGRFVCNVCNKRYHYESDVTAHKEARGHF